MMKKLFNYHLIFLILSMSLNTLSAFGSDWETRAVLEVNNTGINEAVMPPELLLKTPAGKYDIALTGPDGHPRPFELYMRDKRGRKEIELQPLRIELTENGGFIWETNTPDELLTEIQVAVQERDYTGKVHIESYDGNTWQFIARNQAVYKSSGVARAVIDILDGHYKKIRLHFTSFDKRFKQKIVPLKRVVGIIQKTGKNYAFRDIVYTQKIRRTENNDFTEMKTVLQGKGLNIQEIHLETSVQFQGFWEIGYETVSHGRSRFMPVTSGNISYVTKDRQSVALAVDKVWPAKTLILRLKPDTGYIGALNLFNIRVRLPRLVFSADMAGKYIASTGTGSLKRLLPHPGDAKRFSEHLVSFSKPEINPLYNTRTLVEKYQIKGGPFNGAGYLWNSSFIVAEPGYYKLNFNLKSSLDRAYKNVRLVKDGQQIPFFFGRYENKTIDLENDSEYDSNSNTSSMIITIPEVSNQWKYLVLTSSGIFKRTLNFYRKKPGNTGWEKILSRNWQNTSSEEVRLRIQLASLFTTRNKIKIEINHGDNQPIEIKSIKGIYRAPTINFLAHQTGEYTLYGGNSQTSQAEFDLSLVQQRLLETLPVEIQMAEIKKAAADGWRAAFVRQFRDQGWGLYCILGLVTILLLGIIMRLFPKIEAEQTSENGASLKEIEHKKSPDK